jgi:hypothetical protein
MLIGKEKRDAIMERLIARWTKSAETSRNAHYATWARGGYGGLTTREAIAGAQNNVLQVVAADVTEILCGLDPTKPIHVGKDSDGKPIAMGHPLDNTFPAALAAAQEAIAAYLASFDADVDDATRLAVIDELQTTLTLLREYVPMAVLEAMMAGQGAG